MIINQYPSLSSQMPPRKRKPSKEPVKSQQPQKKRQRIQRGRQPVHRRVPGIVTETLQCCTVFKSVNIIDWLIPLIMEYYGTDPCNVFHARDDLIGCQNERDYWHGQWKTNHGTHAYQKYEDLDLEFHQKQTLYTLCQLGGVGEMDMYNYHPFPLTTYGTTLEYDTEGVPTILQFYAIYNKNLVGQLVIDTSISGSCGF